MKKIIFSLVLFAIIGLQAYAQNTVTGTVTNADDGAVMPGVNVAVKGTTTGTMSGGDGTYSLNLPQDATTLVFSFIGMKTQEVVVSGSVINVAMMPDEQEIEEVVVTALGISREKKSLGYAVQEFGGDKLNTVKTENFVNSISGKVSGVQIKNNGNMGGSTNIIVRGSSSLTGNNQALFVIDGVPVNNSNTNNAGQISGRSGYDYGNAVSDLNPEDIESMSVLKGAAATALYGSRAANGVILIVTKKGKKGASGNGLGVAVNSNMTLGVIDKTTFPTYQSNYGAGYFTGFRKVDVDGDGVLDNVARLNHDASMGEKFDPNVMVYQWDAFEPLSPNYMKKTPWVSSPNGAETFFNKSFSYTNSVELTGGTDVSSFRLSYTNLDQTGILPNSSIKRNNYNFSGSTNLTKTLKVSATANYVNTRGKGRNSTGYSDNIMSEFRQWHQTNVDYKILKDMYDATGKNVTWNPKAWNNSEPAYWDNPYFNRHKNYETDERNRLIGSTQAEWTATDYLSFTGRVSIDTYNEVQEERKAIGSASGEFGVQRPDVTSGYSRFDKKFTETNVDVFANFHKTIGTDFSTTALVGLNIRRSKLDQVYESTNGGISIADLYALSNSVDAMLPPEETFEEVGVNGVFASASVGYKNFTYLEATVRRDQSSTLPSSENYYYYPSVSWSILLSELIKANWLSLSKFRINYAEVGNDAAPLNVYDTYVPFSSFSGNAVVSVNGTKNNGSLESERTKNKELGYEMSLFSNRLGFDFAVYQKNTVDQIIPLTVSVATGYSFKYVNSGEIENRGIEFSLHGTPVQAKDFRWNVNLNWSKNKNEVKSLYTDEYGNKVKNLQIASFQGGVSVNATVGKPYGTIQGSDFTYTEDGQKIVDANGYYVLSSTSDIVIGNVNPDWNAGFTNSVSYKNISFSFLIDWQKGGSVFSLDQYYGQSGGLYPESDYLNDYGNPVRDPITYIVDGDPASGYNPETCGGLILSGVNADGTPNTTRIEADYSAFGGGDGKRPNSEYIYDASYVKLREVSLTYSLPKTLLSKTFLSSASFSIVGSNLWIIHKNLPYADPEAGQSSGNAQGWQSGVLPSTRTFGFNINLKF